MLRMETLLAGDLAPSNDGLRLRLFRSLCCHHERRPGQVPFFGLIRQADRFVALTPRHDPVIESKSRMPTPRFPPRTR